MSGTIDVLVRNRLTQAPVSGAVVTATLVSGRIVGTVTDAATAAKLAGASVVATGPSPWSRTTDANGFYVSPPVNAGTYQVTASRAGYANLSWPVIVAWGQTATRDFAMVASAIPSRDAALWPFSKLSPFTRPLGADATYAVVNKSIFGTSGYSSFNGMGVNTEFYTKPVWIAGASDPTRIIYRKDRAMAQYPRRIPNNAVASLGTDGHMIVVEPGRRYSFEMYKAVKRTDGDWECNGASVDVDLQGSGLDYQAWDGITVAAGVSAMAGLIRGGELTNGISHALEFVTDNGAWNKNAPGGRKFVYPANSQDGDGSSYGTTGNLYFGSLLAIPPNVVLSSLGLETVWGMNLAKALQDYGAYGCDSGATYSSVIFRYDYAAKLAGVEPELFLTANYAAFERDMDRIYPHLQIVTNAHNGGFAPTLLDTEGTGGGAPRVPLAPDF